MTRSFSVFRSLTLSFAMFPMWMGRALCTKWKPYTKYLLCTIDARDAADANFASCDVHLPRGAGGVLDVPDPATELRFGLEIALAVAGLPARWLEK